MNHIIDDIDFDRYGKVKFWYRSRSLCPKGRAIGFLAVMPKANTEIILSWISLTHDAEEETMTIQEGI